MTERTRDYLEATAALLALLALIVVAAIGLPLFFGG